MIGIELRVEQVEGISPAYAEAYGQWTVNTPVTKKEYDRFVEKLDKAKITARHIYLNKWNQGGLNDRNMA